MTDRLEQGKILTRSGRKKAGLPPPTPLFTGTSHLIQRGKRQQQSHTTKEEGASSNGSRSGNSVKKSVGGCVVGRPRCGQLTDNGLLGDEESSSDEDKGVLWVQCDNKDCQKWRKLSADSDQDLSGKWFCHMHPDPVYQLCSAPEEKWKVSWKRAFTYSRLSPGQLVWTKAAGWSPWPAIVSPDPWSQGEEHISEERIGCIYHVEFLGKIRTHLWIPEEQLEPYHSRHSCSFGAIRRSKRLDFALDQADSFLSLTDQERMALCEYRKDTIARMTPQENCPAAGPKPGTQMKREQGRPKSTRRGSVEGTLTHLSPLTDLSNKSSSEIDDELAPPVKLFENLGIPFTIENVVKLACSMLQPQPTEGTVHASKLKAPRNDKSHITSVDHPTATTSSTQTISRGSQPRSNDASLLTTQYRDIASSTAVAPPRQQSSVPTAETAQRSLQAPSLSHTSNSCPLTQTSLSLLMNGTVQLTKGRRRKQSEANGSSKRLGQATVGNTSQGRKGKGIGNKKRAIQQKGTHIIPQYFKQTTTYQREDQLVPQGVPAHTTEYLQGECEAHDELREIEDMLSLFDESQQPTCSHGNSVCTAAEEPQRAPDKDPELSIESMLSEMTEIEGLIQNLSRGNVVLY